MSSEHTLNISIPFRQSSAVNLEEPIKHYVETRYGQDFGDFVADVKTLEKMRTLAIQATDPHVSAIKKLQSYAAQLVWLEARFPIDLGVEFTWFSSLGYNASKPTSHATLKFELANVLFNLAALYSHLACSSRNDEEGYKSAGTYFCASAGILKYLQSAILPELRVAPPSDMDPWTLESLENLMLAQAQECFWQRAVHGEKLSDATIAKFAAAAADMYASAADSGTRSDGIRSEWLHHMKARHYFMMGAAQFRMSRDNLEKGQHGEEVARLKDGLDCVETGINESRYINHAVVSDLYNLKAKLEQEHKTAEKDNDVIYYLPVPPKSELKPLERRVIATSKVPTEISDPLSMLGEKSELGKRLFENLVPYAVQEAQAQYETEKTEKINSTVINDIERLNREVQDLLKSLDLPGAMVAVQQPLGVPDDILNRAKELRQQDAPNRLRSSVQSLQSMKASAQQIFAEAVSMLRAEADEDNQSRRKFGTDRWSRPTSQLADPALYGQINTFEGWLAHARSSDEMISTRIADNEKLIVLLAGPQQDLEAFIPSSANVALPPALGQAMFNLQQRFDDWNRIVSRRKRKIEDIRTKAREDNVYPLLVREAARLESESITRRINVEQLTSLFPKRLEKYDKERDVVREEELTQAKIIDHFKTTHAAFVAAKKGDTSSKKRGQVLQSLDKAYFSYKEIISNLEGAKKFYKDFLDMVAKFRDQCLAFTYKRRTEAAHVYSELAPDISTLNISNSAALQEAKMAEAKVQKPKAQTGEPLVAPQPTRATPAGGMWDPSMGIQFGSAASGPGSVKKPTGNEAQARSGTGGWDPTKGIKFN